MELNPFFWNRIIVYVDEPCTPISRIQKQILLSQALQIDIFVTRRNSDTNADPKEYENCRHIINTVMPYLPLCRLLSFEVIHSSSLPSLSDDFAGPAPFLAELTLRSRIDDRQAPGRSRETSATQIPLTPFYCPRLSKIDVDGRNFIYAVLDRPEWTTMLKANSVAPEALIPHFSIILSNFVPAPELAKDNQFTLDSFVAFVGEFDRIDCLHLDRVQFNDDDFDPDTVQRISTQIIDLYLTGLPAEFMWSLSRAMNYSFVESMFLIQCGLVGIRTPSPIRLVLVNIEATEDLSKFIRRWKGIMIEFDKCPGLNDSVLERLRRTQKNSSFILDIIDCEGFTVGGLKSMVSRVVVTSEGGDTNAPDDVYVRVRGLAPAVSSESEFDWFREQMAEFVWDATSERQAS